jgi:hypothetical protein
VTDTDLTPAAPSIEDVLDAWLDAQLTELGEQPTDLDHAGKLLGAQRGIDRRIAEIDAVVAKRIEALRAFHREQRDPLLARRQHLDGLIGGWALAEWERTGRKTWKVPEGTIEVRPRKPRMEIDARITIDDAVLDRVEGPLPAAVKTERSILVSKVASDDVWQVGHGNVIADYPGVPEGYEAREVLISVPGVPDDDEGKGAPEVAPTVLRGVVAMVPLPGRAGQVATPRPGKGSK